MERESSVKISATVYKQLEEQTKTVAYTDNGTYNVSPDPGYWLSNVNVEVHVDLNLSVISELSAVISGLNDLIATITNLTINENGTYTPPEGVLGYNSINVSIGGDCSELEAQIQALEAEVAALEAENSTLETKNNTLEASNTQLESQIASIGTLSVTENGTYTPEAGILGWNNVEVNVAGGGGSGVLVIQDDTLFRCENTELPFKIDSSAVTEFIRMFSSCGNLITIPSLNTSKGTDFSWMFSTCTNLMTIPPLDTSNGTDFSYMFSYCSKLTTFPPLDTSNGTDFSGMFNGDNNLITIPTLNASNVTKFNYMFSGCSNIENITFIGSINANIDFSPCHKKLTYESVKSILTACSNTTNTNAKTLKFKRTLTDQNSELTDLIATCTSKGWTITGLTLN